MKRVVHLPQPGFEHVRVDLRRRQVGVAEHGLDRAQIRAALEQMRRERVPEHVRAEVRADAGLAAVGLQELPESTARQPAAAARVDEQPRRLLARLRERRPCLRRGSAAPSRPRCRRAARCAACRPCRGTAGSPDRVRTSVTRRPTSSDTRKPVAYSTSISARSRRPRGVDDVGRREQRVDVFERQEPRQRGERARRLQVVGGILRRRAPMSRRKRKKPRTAATSRAVDAGDSPEAIDSRTNASRSPRVRRVERPAPRGGELRRAASRSRR